MVAPIVLDITHLMLRMHRPSPTGTDKVHLGYTDHLARPNSNLAAGMHFGMGWLRLVTPERVGVLVRASAQLQDGVGITDDKVFSALCDWIKRQPADNLGLEIKRLSKPMLTQAERLKQAVGYLRLALPRGSALHVPPNSVYLSIAQPGAWAIALRLWLKRRRDVKPVFFVHDLLPLDYPEYFPNGYKTQFSQFIDMIVHFAAGCIVATEIVASRLRLELVRRHGANVPIHIAPLPPPPPFAAGPDEDLSLQETPYFVVCGTIEPRKNHLMLLSLWRELIKSNAKAPKLVIVGQRGWENEQVVDLLERCNDLRGHVIEVSGLSTLGLKRLLSNACATLLPTFGEGYGLPLVEALSLSVPTVVSDIPVCHEVTQGCAVYRHPLDGPGWRDAVMSLSFRYSPIWKEAQMSAGRFHAPSWNQYFVNLSEFLEEL